MKLNWSITHSPTLRDSQQHTYITRTYNNRNIPKMKLNSDHMKHRKTQISTPYIVVGRTAMSYVDIHTCTYPKTGRRHIATKHTVSKTQWMRK